MVSNQLPQDVYYDYLYTINPIAERIRKDVDATKDAYQSLWGQLSADEQNKILEESIISPETVLKYSKYKKSDVSLLVSTEVILLSIPIYYTKFMK